MVSLTEHSIVDRHLSPLLGEDLGADRRLLSLHRLADVVDVLATVSVDLRDIGVLEQVGEEAGEFLALGRGAGLPVPSQAPLSGFLEVEDVIGDLANRRPALGRLVVAFQVGPLEDLDHLIDVPSKFLSRRAGMGSMADEDEGRGNARDREE